MIGTDHRIEACLDEVRRSQDQSLAQFQENARFHFEELEKMFRDDEIEERKKEEAGQRGRALFRVRASEEMDRHKGTSEGAHWQRVLNAIDNPARFPREP
jgi:hypothetical protein